MTTRIVLNADDYGMTGAVDAGILELLDRRRLTGVSAMSAASRWPAGGSLLADYARQADLGLHFTLTGIPPLSGHHFGINTAPPNSFATIWKAAQRRTIEQAAVLRELKLQWEAFADVAGRPPAHIDSHQHVHQLPVIRDAVTDFVSALPAASRPYLRTSYAPITTILRGRANITRALALAFAARPFRRRAARARVVTNHSLSGVYDFSPGPGYRKRFQSFVATASGGMIVLCHPAVPTQEADPADPIAAARAAEYAYFMSPAFDADLAYADVALAKFRAVSPVAPGVRLHAR